MTDVTNTQSPEGAELSAADEQLLRELTERARAGGLDARDLALAEEVRSLYAARGASEYWIVDPENCSVEVHRRNEAGELVFDKSLLHGDEITSGLLPEFSLPVDSLFV